MVRHPNRGVFVATLGPGEIHDVYTVRRFIGGYRREPRAGGGGGMAVEEGRPRQQTTRKPSAAPTSISTGDRPWRRAGVFEHHHEPGPSEMRLRACKATVEAHFYRGYLDDNEEFCQALEAGH